MKKRSLQRGGGTSIPDYEITDLATFNNVTSDPHQVAGLYFYSILDCLVELAYKLSHLFFYSPWLFVDLTSPTIPPLVAELHARYGSSEFLPNTEQRSEIYKPIFGRAADYSSEEGGIFLACATISLVPPLPSQNALLTLGKKRYWVVSE